MKSCLVIFFILISGTIFCQKKEIVKFNKVQLSKVNLLSELVEYDTKNTNSVSWEVVTKVNGKLVAQENKGDSLSEEVKSILRTVDVGTKMYFDIMIDPRKSKSDKSTIQTFAILVAE